MRNDIVHIIEAMRSDEPYHNLITSTIFLYFSDVGRPGLQGTWGSAPSKSGSACDSRLLL